MNKTKDLIIKTSLDRKRRSLYVPRTEKPVLPIGTVNSFTRALADSRLGSTIKNSDSRV